MKRFLPILLRLLLLAIVVALFAWLGNLSAVEDFFSLQALRENTEELAGWGVALYLAAFAIGNLVQVPSLLFIVISLLVYGPFWGSALAMIGSLLATSLSYWVVRLVGGTPLREAKNRYVRALLAQIDDHPIRTLIVGRTFLYMSPLLNYPLALAKMPFGIYLIASALGFAVPILAIALFLEWVLLTFNLA